MIKSTITPSGILYIVATPIGHLNDLSPRAIETLQSVDCIFAEDTRHAGILLKHVGIHKPLQSMHVHNEQQKSHLACDMLAQGKHVALISDAGTPLISDPGFTVVREARLKDFQVIPIPGPCALITALSASGVACDTFLFLGFLPAQQTARQKKLKETSLLGHTVVLYESPHRLSACLTDIETIFGIDHAVVLAKELTKTFEHIMLATVTDIRAWLQADVSRKKGEFVLIIPPLVLEKNDETAVGATDILRILLRELPLKQAVKLAAEITQQPKNQLYTLALDLSQ